MVNFTLKKLIDNKALSDVCFLITNNSLDDNCNSLDDNCKLIWANRAILSYNSPVFKAMLYGNMREGNNISIKQKNGYIFNGKIWIEPIEIIDITYKVFHIMLEYMYTGSVKYINTHTCIPLIYASKKYQLDELFQKCSNSFLTNISCDSVHDFIQTLSLDNPWSHQNDIITLCLNYIENNGDEFLKSDKFNNLPQKIVFNIVESSSLAVTSEINVFNAIIKWIKYNNFEFSKNKPCQIIDNKKRKLVFSESSKLLDFKKKILSHIRFIDMTIDDILGPVKSENIFSDSELISIINYISNKQTCYGTKSLSLLDSSKDEVIFLNNLTIYNKHRSPPNIIKKEFIYQRDFDDNGIIYYLGCENENKFTDPKLLKKIRICSTTTNTSDTSSNILTSRSFQTKGWIGYSSRWSNNKCPWISVDFGPHRKIKLTYYTLIHSWPTTLDSLRSWTIEGCNPDNLGNNSDEKESKENNGNNRDPFIYTPNRLGYSFNENNLEWIQIHERKDDESLNSGWATNSWNVNCNKAFRMIRIRSTGPDKSNTEYLSIGGIEFYGSLFMYTKISPVWDY